MVKIGKNESLALNNMRGIAAFYVMLGHFEVVARFVPSFIVKFIPDPVAIFFIISGILIPLSLSLSLECLI